MQLHGRGAEERLSGLGQGWARDARHICWAPVCSAFLFARVFSSSLLADRSA